MHPRQKNRFLSTEIAYLQMALLRMQRRSAWSTCSRSCCWTARKQAQQLCEVLELEIMPGDYRGHQRCYPRVGPKITESGCLMSASCQSFEKNASSHAH